MKLIIDIPDNEYKHIKEYYEKNDTVEATYSYIYHGIPLEKVIEDIKQEIFDELHHIGEGWEEGEETRIVLEDVEFDIEMIFDKHLKGESE